MKNWFTRPVGQRGQTLPMMVLMVIVLFAFVGLGIDAGFAYLTRASLSKAVDAACMIGIRNLAQGQPTALLIARSTFDMNYNNSGSPGRQVTPPVVTSGFTTTANGNVQLDMNAVVPINTFFLRVFPQWKVLNVRATGQARRAKVVMSLVLDRSGSMNGNNGATALPPAVGAFIDSFDETVDRAGMSSFASHATVNVNPIASPFKTAIKNAANALPFVGGTFSQGGLTNGYAQIQAFPVVPGEDIVKVCVFFTDGLANIIQHTLNCGGTPTLMNFGGYDSGTTVAFFNPATGVQLSCDVSGGTPPCCTGVTTFRSAIDGTQKAFLRANVTAEAEFRAVQVAQEMRANGIIVYAVGLGNSINQTFLRQIANDPTLPGHVPTFYDGEALFAPSSAQLGQVFEVLANKIVLRLTQ